MNIQIEIPQGQEAEIFEQAVYGMAGADAIKASDPNAQISGMYGIFQQMISQLGAAVPDEQRKSIYATLHEKAGTSPLHSVPSDNGEEQQEQQPEQQPQKTTQEPETTQPIEPLDITPKPETDESGSPK